MTNQPSDNLNKALPDWVCFPDDEPSHLTNRVQYEYGTGCPEHEIAGGSSLPTAQLQALINNEKIAEHEYIIAKYELMYQRIAKKNGVVRKTPHTAFHQISKTRVAELKATLKKGEK